MAYSSLDRISPSDLYGGSFSRFMHVAALGRRWADASFSTPPAICSQQTGKRFTILCPCKYFKFQILSKIVYMAMTAAAAMLGQHTMPAICNQQADLGAQRSLQGPSSPATASGIACCIFLS